MSRRWSEAKSAELSLPGRFCQELETRLKHGVDCGSTGLAVCDGGRLPSQSREQFISLNSPKNHRILLANPEEPEISPLYSFFEHRELGKFRAERSALGIKIGLANSISWFYETACSGFSNAEIGRTAH
jgi:hypothetical protein